MSETTLGEEVEELRKSVERLSKHALELSHDLDLAALTIRGEEEVNRAAMLMKTRKGTNLMKVIGEDRKKTLSTLRAYGFPRSPAPVDPLAEKKT